MATRGDWLLIGGLAFSAVSLLLFIIGFSTPNWLELDTKYITNSGFQKIGLWEACFKNFAYYKDYTGKIYNGCWWIFSYEYRPIWDYINPPWFLSIQVMMVIALMLLIVMVLLEVLFLIKCCPGKNSVGALFTVGGIGIMAGVFTAICCVIFGAKSVVDRQWIENPDKNYLSWSFGLIVFSGFLMLFGGLCVIVSGLQVRLAETYERRKRPFADYEAKHQPPQYFN